MIIAKALIGRASCVLAVVALGFGAEMAWGQTEGVDSTTVKFATLHSFDGTDGANPQAGLVQGTNGDFYGTTVFGGANSNSFGTIFKITPGGLLTSLHSFCSEPSCADGSAPSAALIQGTNGELYGVAGAGTYGNGMIFKMTATGALTTIYNFCAQAGCPDGSGPLAALLQAANGDIYGTTDAGGIVDVFSCPFGCGTIFKITPSGMLTTLYDFPPQSQCSDSYGPSGLIQATSGDLYGTTVNCGANIAPEAPYGPGTIFKITPGGALTTDYNFCAQSTCSDGFNPSGLIQAKNGDLYGSTTSGGTCLNFYGCGTIFRVTPGGILTTLYDFCMQPGCPDGQFASHLIQGPSGNLYGTMGVGGVYGDGTIFKITPSGTLTTLYSFCSQPGCSDGAAPEGGLVEGTNGVFYGTTYGGGTNGLGTVFSFSVGEPPFVITRPTIGKIGEDVTIVGYGLKGATSVTFNGTPATILKDEPTVSYVKVPTGATTGKVVVTTPSGTLTSNIAFEVTP